MLGKKLAALPPGFHAKLLRAEPEIMQPVALTFDFKGRVWVVECHNHGGIIKEKPWDRIVFFEDSNGDGKLDKRQLFFEHTGYKTTSVLVGMGGVWIMDVWL